jgi:hypothetical protein
MWSTWGGQLSAVFASYGVLTGTIWKLFDRAGKFAPDETKRQLARWLLEAAPHRRLATLAGLFAKAFEAVFGARHLSWTCFWRSAAASMSVVVAVTLIWIALRPEELAEVTDKSEFVSFFAFALIMNVFPDYLALLKTRYVIRAIKPGATFGASLLLVLDAMMSGLLGLLILSELEYFGDSLLSFGFPVSYLLSFYDTLRAFPRIVSLHVTEGFEFPQGAFWYATFLTSVWVWLYIGSAVILSSQRVIGWAWRWLPRIVKVEEFPYSALALVSIALVTTAYLIGAAVAILL